MAASVQCLSSSCWPISSKFQSLSLKTDNSCSSAFKPLGFSSNTSVNVFSTGFASIRPVERQLGKLIVCEAATTKKPDQAAKRARQSEKRRLYHKAHKSEVRTRMRKVLESLEVLRKKTDAQPEEVITVEKLIAEAYSVIDKAVKVGTLHRNTGARRKSRLARRKKAVEIHHGWYTPSPELTA
ncbi:30S ribosomal protein S20, chloroplastic [Heracleum sosnowskyi]|uniref:Small ribosomal subunit protein bS20c n=1 Tax=Heracleum sosnowskyi TaxID=360622 RepID=A0AAD8J2U6_9APIA|nr:30S ribosomal protein S20, chloroplastic [Heracleum sosnowskyi]